MKQNHFSNKPEIVEAEFLTTISCGHDREVSYVAWKTPFGDIVALCTLCCKRAWEAVNVS